jgi:hypothetical protein
MMLKDVEWCWMMLNDVEWCLMMLNDAERCWRMLNDADWCWMMLNDAEECWRMLKGFVLHDLHPMLTSYIIARASRNRVVGTHRHRHRWEACGHHSISFNIIQHPSTSFNIIQHHSIYTLILYILYDVSLVIHSDGRYHQYRFDTIPITFS